MKRETVEDFLARGGVVVRCPPASAVRARHPAPTAQPSSVGAPVFNTRGWLVRSLHPAPAREGESRTTFGAHYDG